MAVRLKDIAEVTGYSIQTVSFSLNGGGTIKTATRELVQKKAEEMGYRPNLLIRGVQTGKTMTAGVLLSMRCEVDTAIFRGISHKLNENDYAPLAIVKSADKPEREHLLNLVDRRVDGVILRPQTSDLFCDHLGEFLKRQIPFVLVDTPPGDLPGDYAGTDDVLGGKMAAEHLAQMKHKNVAVVTTGESFHPMAYRTRSFVDASKVDSLFDNITVVSSNVKDLPKSLTKLLSGDSRPSAVFSTGDFMAKAIYEAAAELGLRIPQDISVIGFGDMIVGSYLQPALTTLAQPFEQIGEAAASILLDRINGELTGKPKRIMIKPTLTIRKSVCRRV